MPRDSLTLSKKSAMLASLSLFALLAGVVARNSLLAGVSIPLIGYLILSLVYSADGGDINLAIERRIEKDTMYEDEPCLVTLEITNQGSSAIEFLELVDAVPSNLEVVEGSSHFVVSLRKGERKFLASYTVKPRAYGCYTFDRPLLARFGDVQETKIATRKYDVATSFMVLPKISYVSKMSIKPRRTRNWPGEIVSPKPGAGLEFYSLRNYEEGDPIRKINWKASSRLSDDNFYTNQFASELGGDTIIALDARTVSDSGKPPSSAINYCVRAAAVISYRLLRDRNRVGLIVLGTKVERVSPGFGRRQFDKILLALSVVQPGDMWDIALLGRFLSIFFSRMVQIVVVSSLNDEKSFDAIRSIARRGYNVIVVSPSPIESEKESSEILESASKKKKNSSEKYYAVGEQFLKVQRQNRINGLRRIATVVDWNIELPLSNALRNQAYQFGRQRRGGRILRATTRAS